MEQESPLLLEKEPEYISAPNLHWRGQSRGMSRLLIWTLCLFSVFSLLLNIFQATLSTSSTDSERCSSQRKLSPYGSHHTIKPFSSSLCANRFVLADLEEPSQLASWGQDSVYTSANNSMADAAWDAINHDSGIVAVDKSWAIQKGLPLGSTFPWDNDKAIYFVNAYHGLHCLVSYVLVVLLFSDLGVMSPNST